MMATDIEEILEKLRPTMRSRAKLLRKRTWEIMKRKGGWSEPVWQWNTVTVDQDNQPKELILYLKYGWWTRCLYITIPTAKQER